MIRTQQLIDAVLLKHPLGDRMRALGALGGESDE